MRLIDAEQIGLTDMEIIMCDGNYKKALEMLIDKIANAPTIEVPQRMKGKWILHIDNLFPVESTMECNQCHEHQPVTIDDNFCPNCGADMREE